MGKASYSSGNINLFQRSYYKRRAAKYMGTADPVTIQKYEEAKKEREKEKQEESNH
jgi:hypothetical protein